MNEKIFSAICFLVLIDHHGGGYEKAHPNYIEEKLMMLNTGYDAYGFLDRENQLKVLDFLGLWRYKWPEKIEEYERQASDLSSEL